MVSVIQLIINAIGEGWTVRSQPLLPIRPLTSTSPQYVLLGGVCVLTAPLIYLEIRMGPVWRAKRKERERRKEEYHGVAEPK